MFNAKFVPPVAVKYKEFKLTTQAGRVGLLCGLTAGTVTREEVEAAVLQDTEKRPYRKPVVAEGKRYASVTEAATALLSKYEKVATFNKKTQAISLISYTEVVANRSKALDALKHRIARLCNADDTEGYYWSE